MGNPIPGRFVARNLGDIARRLNGQLDGDPTVEIHGLAGLFDARAGDLSFVGELRYVPYVARSRASALIVGLDFPTASIPLVRVAKPALAFESLVDWFRPERTTPIAGISPQASVAASAVIADGAVVHAHASIGEHAHLGASTIVHAGVRIGAHVRVGRDCVLHANVVLQDHVRLGDRVVVHSGTVVGCDGFGYRPGKAGLEKLEHIGAVEIGDDVEIGACVTIDRARFGRTTIGRGTKIDNLVQIAHNVQIGEHCVIAAQTGISGSTTIGDGCVFGGQAATAGHVRIGRRVTAAARAGLTKDVQDGAVMFGIYAGPVHEKRREEAALRKLPELLKRVRELEKKLGIADSGGVAEDG
ncbi:MAG: UDP-3-O-(3-hydroxymyristoyl)glucosamine N-acyltransferase [Planctomycetes bacterium]|nr:UDP-3-O-(3-hydroxymyristoyl)glucosamine N-acyltransferase [Planctomycetota bacterium]